MKKGVLLCILAALLFGTAPILLNFILQAGVSKTGCLLLTKAGLMVISLLICRIKKYSLKVEGKKIICLMLMGVFGMGLTVLLLATAYEYIPVSTTMVIHFLYPTIVTLASACFFHKKLTRYSIGAIILSIAGMLCISTPSGGEGGQAIGYLFAILSALTYSFYIAGSEAIDTAHIRMPVVMFYMTLGAVSFLFVQMLITGDCVMPFSPVTWAAQIGYMLVIGAAFSLLNIGIAMVGGVDASFATLCEPVTSVILSVLIYHDPLSLLTIIGFLLIFTAVGLNGIVPKKAEV